MNINIPEKLKIPEKYKTHLKQNRPMVIMLVSLGILFGLIFIYKAFMGYMMGKYMSAMMNPTITVSATKAEYQDWQPKIKASGSFRAVRGVDVTTEIAGLVRTILFTPGTDIKKDELLVELNADTEEAQRQALSAAEELATITFERGRTLLTKQSTSQATVDTDAANLREKQAQVLEQNSIIAKKRIRAPFDGRLGISAINPGQYINPGDKIVTLQALDPIFIDFYVPQQSLVRLKKDQKVTVTSDAYPGKQYKGKITTLDPKADPNTRNVQIEATIENPDHELLPGFFGYIEVDTGEPVRYLTVPQAAISYNPYGDIVYLITEDTKNGKESKLFGKNGKDPKNLIVKQVFVTVGETRGDQISILKGIQENDQIVTSGQLKLKNGSRVVINNSIEPSNNPSPNLVNE